MNESYNILNNIFETKYIERSDKSAFSRLVGRRLLCRIRRHDRLLVLLVARRRINTIRLLHGHLLLLHIRLHVRCGLTRLLLVHRLLHHRLLLVHRLLHAGLHNRVYGLLLSIVN